MYITLKSANLDTKRKFSYIHKLYPQFDMQILKWFKITKISNLSSSCREKKNLPLIKILTNNQKIFLGIVELISLLCSYNKLHIFSLPNVSLLCYVPTCVIKYQNIHLKTSLVTPLTYT